MFELTLFDHLRMTFGHVANRHKAHLQLAYERARWSRRAQAAEALLVAGVFFTSLNIALGSRREYAIAGAILAALALGLLLIRLTFDFDASARAHGLWASRLWLVRERYQAVLSDLADGAIDIETARVRRDALMSEMAAVYQDASAHGVAQDRAQGDAPAAHDAALTDDQIDMFLPGSLRKASNP